MASTRQVNTGTPSGAEWPYPQRDPSAMMGLYELPSREGDADWARKSPKERMRPLSPWAEETVYGSVQNIRDMLGMTPGASPYEQRGLASLGGLLDPQPPGGRAFAGVAEAISPWFEAERDRGRGNFAESLARMGMHRSGAGQELLRRYDVESPMALGAMLAPYAMQGEQMGQQGQLAGIQGLMGYGAQDYERYWRPYSELADMLGLTHSAAPRPKAQQQGTDWLGAILGGVGAYTGAGGKF